MKRSPKRSITFSMRRMSVRSEPMPMIIAGHRRLARPRSIAARIRRTASARPTKIASPIRKWPMLSSTISGSAAIRSAVMKSRPWPAWTSRPALLASAAPPRDTLEFGGARRGVAGGNSLAPRAGVNLDHRRADRGRRFDLHRFGVDEQRHANAGIGQPGDGAAQGVTLAGGIEPAFGRALLPPLGHHARGVRAHPARDRRSFPASPPFRG